MCEGQKGETSQLEMIRVALDRAGYTECPATIPDLFDCFLDYVDAGYWRNLDLDDIRQQIADGEITVLAICRALNA